MNWREYLIKMAKDIAKATNGDADKIQKIIFAYFSLAEKKPTDTLASKIRELMSKK
jgi:hypothetical protein